MNPTEKQDQVTRLRFRDRSEPRRYPHVCEALQTFTSEGSVNLEVGCGGKQYGPFVRGRHFGLDLQRGLYAGQGADTIGSAIHMPVRSGSVDLVFMVATLLCIAMAHSRGVFELRSRHPEAFERAASKKTDGGDWRRDGQPTDCSQKSAGSRLDEVPCELLAGHCLYPG